jgi:hypothetical protein
VLVVGVGSGRQYKYLRGRNLELRGFDISPSLVKVCRERFPEIPTTVDDLLVADEQQVPADCVLTSAVLQHIAPHEIERAVDSVKALSRRLVILRETTGLSEPLDHVWAHEYQRLFEGWRVVLRVTTDRLDGHEVELFGLIPG